MSSTSFENPGLPHPISALSMSRDLHSIPRKPSRDLETEDGSRPISLHGIIDQSSAAYLTSDPSTLLSSNEIHLSPGNQGEAISTRNQPDVIITSGTNILQFPASDVVLSATTDNSYDELETPLSENPPHRPTKVRFRSRVRITSGLSRQRSTSEQNYLTFSDSSSISGSSSSSISAPLRSRTEDEVGKPGWGTLGQRVSILARANSQRRKPRPQQERTLTVKSVHDGILTVDDHDMNERTPLNRHAHIYGCIIDSDSAAVDEDELERSRGIDLVFGPWPNRLMNHRWWWWQMEPIVCCRCLDDSDDDDDG